MSSSPEKSNPNLPLKKPTSWLFKNNKALNNILFSMKLQNLSKQPQPNKLTPQPNKTLIFDQPKLVSDRTSLLSDEILLQILSRLSESQRNSNSLVSKRWLNLQGRLVRSVRILDWNFLLSGRLFTRFPNLIHVDLVNGCVISPRNSGTLLTYKLGSFHIDSNVSTEGFISERCVLSVDEIDLGLKVLASGYPNLRKLVIVNASEMGLLSVAEECFILQELELHMCNDQILRGIAAFRNLQILKLVGSIDGFYSSLVSDIGLTILAQGCKRLVKLELRGCEGSYDGIKAIGQCCQMLEELTLSDHKIEDGWLSALSYCDNLKTLRFLSCKSIDRCPGPDEHLGVCPTLERLHFERCQLREKHSVRALFVVCPAVREVVFKNCWRLKDDIFSTANICRRVKFLSLEGCSRLTTEGLESVILCWKELESLSVLSCNNIKDSEQALWELAWEKGVNFSERHKIGSCCLLVLRFYFAVHLYNLLMATNNVAVIVLYHCSANLIHPPWMNMEVDYFLTLVTSVPCTRATSVHHLCFVKFKSPINVLTAQLLVAICI